MNSTTWPLDFFLERVAEMPDYEAVQEIDLRLIRNLEAKQELSGVDIQMQKAREALNLDDARLRAERHTVVMRMDRKKWSRAVRAIWGQEGLDQAVVWMEMHGDEAWMDQLPLRPKKGPKR